MTRLVWDQPGDRRFQSGCDRGVLYLPDGSSVSWNGITSVSEDFSDVGLQEYYLDGVKYLNRRSTGDYSGTLKALTYPNEFFPFDGVSQIDPGVFATNQSVKSTFGLSYRTKIGNDLVGLDFGYKLHLLYNLTAVPDSQSFSSQSSVTSPEEFSWKLSGVPIVIESMRPTVHVVIDSSRLPAGYLEGFENSIYGSDSTFGALPNATTLYQLSRDSLLPLITEPI